MVIRRRLLWLLATLGVAVLVRVAWLKSFSIDEFQYAHAAWAMANGELPYRDFFLHYVPLLPLLVAPIFAVGGDDPGLMAALRWPMLAFAALSLWATAGLARRLGAQGLVAVVLLLTSATFVHRATELRPDGAATALFLAALWLGATGRCWKAGLGAGALLGSALLVSQKVIFLAPVIAVALALDGTLNRASETRLFAPARWVAAGTLLPLVGFLIFLAASGAWPNFAEHTLAWSIFHQQHYPGFSWPPALLGVLSEQPVLALLAAGGLVLVTTRWWRSGAERWRRPEVLILLATGAAFASMALTRAPYPYTFVPLLPFLALLAAAGASAWPTLTAPLLVLAALVGALSLEPPRDNRHQLAELALLGRLTAPSDPVFDNAGAAVARPHVVYHYYNDALSRHVRREALATEVPRALRERRCKAVLRDLRSDGLPDTLRAYLAENYQPYDGDLALWGRRFSPGDLDEDREFWAIDDGRYFVHASAPGELLIDGTASGGIFSLSHGAHRLRWRGVAAEVYVLWLPRDGVPYTPAPQAVPRFSILL